MPFKSGTTDSIGRRKAATDVPDKFSGDAKSTAKVFGGNQFDRNWTVEAANGDQA